MIYSCVKFGFRSTCPNDFLKLNTPQKNFVFLAVLGSEWLNISAEPVEPHVMYKWCTKVVSCVCQGLHMPSGY